MFLVMIVFDSFSVSSDLDVLRPDSPSGTLRTFVDILPSGVSEPLFIDICGLDISYFCSHVFGFTVKDFHRDWFSLIHDNRFSVLQAFRGSGKSTLLGVVYPLWLCYFYPNTRILLCAGELSQCTKILDDVKDFIETNEFLRVLLPDNRSLAWNKTNAKLSNGSSFVCKTWTKRIKGLHVDYAFIDEVQDIYDREIYNKALTPTVTKRKGTIVATGVSDYPGDMLEELAHRPGYVSRLYPVLSDVGISLWPEDFPISELQRIRGDSESTYQTQYMLNSSAASDNAVYPAHWISNCYDYHEKFSPLSFEGSICFIGADFAISDGPRADFDCYVVIEKVSGKTVIRHGERHKGLPTEAKKQRLKDLYSKYHPLRMVLDPSNIGTTLIKELRNEGYPVVEGEFHAGPRHKLLVGLQIVMQPDKDGLSCLVIPRNSEDEACLTFTNKLVEEMLGFKEEKSQATGIMRYVSKAAHDDTVAALALACKASSEQREFQDLVGQ